ncbi:MAG TPA: hypothetical protein VFL81_00725 [Candidatus Saccharimonadales bacterium]|nr:hypothetical protein [Candidatus Saccharimonadales bacterium]
MSKPSIQSTDQTLKVKVLSPNKVYFDGEATSLSATNNVGKFDILPEHHNFITLLTTGDIVIKLPTNDEEKFTVSGGLLRIKSNVVSVFLDI